MKVMKAKQNGQPLWGRQLVLLLSPKDKFGLWFCKQEILPKAEGTLSNEDHKVDGPAL